MINLIPIRYNFTQPFGCIRMTSGPNNQLSLLCISTNNSFEVRFDNFLGVENREEFFDRNNSSIYNFKKIENQIWNYPISYSTSDQIIDLLSTYETTLINNKTRLWVLLSQSNCIEVFSNSMPKIFKWSKSTSLQNDNAICAICGNKELQSKIILLNYNSKEDNSSQQFYVHSMCLKSATINEMMYHPEIEKEMEEIFI